MGCTCGRHSNGNSQEKQSDMPADKIGAKESEVNFSTMTEMDSRIPLTVRQAFKLAQSWKAIKRNISAAGVEMFVRLFKTNANLKYLFGKFRNLESEDELRCDETLEHHATLVMSTLDDAIMHIDNYDYVVELLKKTGATHIRFEGFRSDNFMKIKEPFLDAVKITLGDRYTENMESIYQIAITFILQTLCEGIEDAALGDKSNKASKGKEDNTKNEDEKSPKANKENACSNSTNKSTKEDAGKVIRNAAPS